MWRGCRAPARRPVPPGRALRNVRKREESGTPNPGANIAYVRIIWITKTLVPARNIVLVASNLRRSSHFWYTALSPPVFFDTPKPTATTSPKEEIRAQNRTCRGCEMKSENPYALRLRQSLCMSPNSASKIPVRMSRLVAKEQI